MGALDGAGTGIGVAFGSGLGRTGAEPATGSGRAEGTRAAPDEEPACGCGSDGTIRNSFSVHLAAATHRAAAMIAERRDSNSQSTRGAGGCQAINANSAWITPVRVEQILKARPPGSIRTFLKSIQPEFSKYHILQGTPSLTGGGVWKM